MTFRVIFTTKKTFENSSNTHISLSCSKCHIFLGWVYPIVTHWVWSEGTIDKNQTLHGQGWLNKWGFVDFAGSGVVHALGGTAALVACIIIGPRKGRFGDFEGRPIQMSGHSMPMAALGGFILLFGFLAFNAGSQVL